MRGSVAKKGKKWYAVVYDDLAGVANLDDEALDAGLAAGRRIVYARHDLDQS